MTKRWSPTLHPCWQCAAHFLVCKHRNSKKPLMPPSSHQCHMLQTLATPASKHIETMCITTHAYSNSINIWLLPLNSSQNMSTAAWVAWDSYKVTLLSLAGCTCHPCQINIADSLHKCRSLLHGSVLLVEKAAAASCDTTTASYAPSVMLNNRCRDLSQL